MASTSASGAHLRVKLTSTSFDNDPKSPSLLLFRIHPGSSHCQKWSSELEITTQIITNLVEITEDEFLSEDTDKTSDAISRLFPYSLDLEPKVRRVAVSKIICEALDILTAHSSKNISGRNSYKWIMNVKIRIVTMYQLEPDDEEFTRSSRLVPARLSSIQELKKKRDEDECKERMCAICRGKFVIGSVVSWMPCSHRFHEQCLFAWLSRSHYCPLCRFEMPRPHLRIN